MGAGGRMGTETPQLPTQPGAGCLVRRVGLRGASEAGDTQQAAEPGGAARHPQDPQAGCCAAAGRRAGHWWGSAPRCGHGWSHAAWPRGWSWPGAPASERRGCDLGAPCTPSMMGTPRTPRPPNAPRAPHATRLSQTPRVSQCAVGAPRPAGTPTPRGPPTCPVHPPQRGQPPACGRGHSVGNGPPRGVVPAPAPRRPRRSPAAALPWEQARCLCHLGKGNRGTSAGRGDGDWGDGRVLGPTRTPGQGAQPQPAAAPAAEGVTGSTVCYQC